MRLLYLFFTPLIILALVLSGCDVMKAIAPPPQAIIIPTETVTPAAATVTPTFGAPEYIDTAFCWESHIDEAEFNLIRFFPNGTLIDVFVQPYRDCMEAWNETESYYTTSALEKFNHGEYHLSGDRIKFTLIKANGTEVIGEVNGTYLVDKMLLRRQGAEEWEYVRVWKVKNDN